MTREIQALFLTRYGRKGASSRYRSLQYEAVLKEQGIHATYSPLFEDSYLDARYGTGRGGVAEMGRGVLRRAWKLVGGGRYDVVVIEKELIPYFPAVFERLLAWAGVPYVIDYDDATFHAYDQNPRRLVKWLLGGKIAAAMRHARCVVAGNEYLADYARRAGARRVAILPTVVDLDRYPPATRERQGVFTIGWIGSPFSSRYLELIGPALAAVCSEGRARIVLVGAPRSALAAVPREVLPWSEATEVRDIQAFDVGIMPVVDEPWAWGKCGLKLIQYMACGLPVVASPVGVNRQIVEPGVNGFLADTPEEWVNALTTLRDQPTLAAEMGRAGRRKVEERYSLRVAGVQLASILKSAAGRDLQKEAPGPERPVLKRDEILS